MNLQDIRSQIRQDFLSNSYVVAKYGLDSTKTFDEQFSKLSLESIFIDIMALAIWSLVGVFNLHMIEVKNSLKLLKPHTLRWYRDRALSYRLGQNLIQDTDQYDDTGLTQIQIDNMKVVKRAAAIETMDSTGIPVVRIKVATTDSAGKLATLPSTVVASIKAYFADIKDAGVKLLVSSNSADNFKSQIDIYYNPLVLDQNGLKLSGGSNYPVLDAINNYLSNLPFNGEYTIMALTDMIQQVEGVEIVQVNVSQAKYGNLAYHNTGAKYIPDAGYMIANPSDQSINYIPYNGNE